MSEPIHETIMTRIQKIWSSAQRYECDHIRWYGWTAVGIHSRSRYYATISARFTSTAGLAGRRCSQRCRRAGLNAAGRTKAQCSMPIMRSLREMITCRSTGDE